MSRAFVRESDGAETTADLPERPVSPHPNFVTARGLQQIVERIHALEHERAEAKRGDDAAAVARVDRDLRYWLQRKAAAKLVEPEPEPGKVRFATRVTLRYDSGDERSYTLVGEDEADPPQGLISWISPIAQALLGASVGDEVQLQGQHAEILRLQAAG